MQNTNPNQHSCETCGNVGVVQAMAGKDTWKPIPCPDCENGREYQRLILNRQFKKSGITPAYGGFTFDSLRDVMTGKDWAGKHLAYGAALCMADGCYPFTLDEAAERIGLDWYRSTNRSARNSVVFTGPVGTGKTGLAISIANALMGMGKNVLYARVGDLLESLQATYRDGYQGATLSELLYTLKTVPVLVWDEFEVNRMSDDKKDLVEKIIRGRQRDDDGTGRMLPLVATTNLTLEQFYTLWGPRIADIVATAHWIKVDGVKLRDTVRAEEGV